MQVDSNALLTRIGQIAIPVQDIDRAVHFYRDQLGLSYLFSAGTLAFFDCGGVRLMLTLPEGAGTAQQSSVLYYAVDDIHAAYQALSARAVPFVDAPHLIAEMGTYDLWMAFFRDPDGNLMGIMGEIPRPQ